MRLRVDQIPLSEHPINTIGPDQRLASMIRSDGDQTMSNTGAIAVWVATFSLMGIVFGEMAYAGKMDPGYVNSGRVAVRGVVISPYRGP